jgi:acrylyl-CoA reductase (NADPH)
MTETGFKALVLDEADGKVTPPVRTLEDRQLPEGDVTVAVVYSTLNYKDGMIVKGLGRLVRQYPHVPGIDFAGTVVESASPRFAPGDEVILTGWRVGETRWGGLAARARVKADWLVRLPDGLTLKEAMAIGTAGLAAMLAIIALEQHGLTPQAEGEVLVTGAAGGVGSVATAVLARLGYRVAASTGRPDTHDYLKDLGAASIVPREELLAAPKGPLASERWAGAIDSVGGAILANLLTAMRYRASCASVGLAAGPQFTATVVPFLLRGVNLLGIDSNLCALDRREAAWSRLARDLPKDKLEGAVHTVPLGEVAALAATILQGGVRGRIVVDVNA